MHIFKTHLSEKPGIFFRELDTKYIVLIALINSTRSGTTSTSPTQGIVPERVEFIPYMFKSSISLSHCIVVHHTTYNTLHHPHLLKNDNYNKGRSNQDRSSSILSNDLYKQYISHDIFSLDIFIKRGDLQISSSVISSWSSSSPNTTKESS